MVSQLKTHLYFTKGRQSNKIKIMLEFDDIFDADERTIKQHLNNRIKGLIWIGSSIGIGLLILMCQLISTL